MWQNELVSRFEKAGEIGEAGAVRVRIGDRPHLHTAAIVVWADEYVHKSDSFHSVRCENVEDAAERTAEILHEGGFASQFTNCRVDFLHRETGLPLRSWNSTEPLNGVEAVPAAPVEQVLCDVIQRNNAEMRRMVSMLCETIQGREERIDRDRDDLMDLSRQEVLARAESELTQILAEEAVGAEDEVDPLKAHAGELLGALAQKFLGNGSSPRDTVLAILRDDPQLTASLASDQEVVNLFTQAVLKETQGTPEAEPDQGTGDVEEPEPPPSPMPE